MYPGIDTDHTSNVPWKYFRQAMDYIGFVSWEAAGSAVVFEPTAHAEWGDRERSAVIIGLIQIQILTLCSSVDWESDFTNISASAAKLSFWKNQFALPTTLEHNHSMQNLPTYPIQF